MKNKKIIVSVVSFILLVVTLFIVNISNGNITSMRLVNYNGDNLKISVDGVTANTLPISGTYYLADYDCKNANTKLSWDKENYKLNVTNGTDEGGLSCYLDFQSQPLLSSMEVGSYVAYIGNNGCDSEQCDGINANFVDDNNMGYCYGSNYKFITNGWRIGYIEDGSAYLISAGATDCTCADNFGDIVNDSSSCGDELSVSMLSSYVRNLNELALKYCNGSYAKDGVCDNTTAWMMNVSDFEKITGSVLNNSSCYVNSGNKLCGYANDLIDNGGMYWLATPYSTTASTLFTWSGSKRRIGSDYTDSLRGVRPVLYLDPSVVVTSGSGSYDDPYLIGNANFVVNDGSNYVNDNSNVVLKMAHAGGVSTMCVNVNSSGCSNYVNFTDTYTLDWSDEKDGKKHIYVYYKNSQGKVIASMDRTIILDTVAPSDNKVSIDDETSLNTTLTLSSNGADYMCFSNTSSDVDNCDKWVEYDTSYDWKLLGGEGSKVVYAFFKDKAGNVGEVAKDVISYTLSCLGISGVKNISYTGAVVTSGDLGVKLCAGTYKLQVWGAQGGNSGGKGGYSVGEITLTGTESLYFYVGGAGGKGSDAGFNGGGTAGTNGGAGGGATDIRIGQDSLYARVIVAGGGGGSGQDSCAIGGVGGGTTGAGNASQGSCDIQASGGMQNSGGVGGTYSNVTGASGTFGIGGSATDGTSDGGAGGGGWYGGGAGASAAWSNGGGGGSGFVYTSSSALPSGYLVASSYLLANASTIAGNQNTIPTTNGSGTETGHTGNGYIKITRLS